MISTIIVSEDKPAQLHLLLDSLYKNGRNLFDITVLYKYSDVAFEKGYEIVQQRFYNKYRYNYRFPIRWAERASSNLSEDLLLYLKQTRLLVCLFNDENVLFSNELSYRDVFQVFSKYNPCTLSLRLGNNTVIQNAYNINDYFIDKPSGGEFILDNFMLWDASLVKPFTNFSMPFSHNGHVYTTKLINFILEKTKIKDINDFEKALQDNLYMGAFGGFIPPSMSCLEYSAVINNSPKKVSDEIESDFGTSNFGLNDRYLSGSKIDYDFFNFKHISKPFEEFVTRFTSESYMHYGR